MAGTKNKSTKSTRSNTPRKGAPQKGSSASSSVADIVGVAIAAVGLALLVAVVSSHTGVVTEAIASGMKYLFGIGAYLLPVTLILWGVSFFIPNVAIQEAKIAIGLALVITSIISLVSLATPGGAYLDASVVSHYGGWYGGVLSWLCVKLTGQIIAAILLVALGLIGILVTGLSFSDLTAAIAEKIAMRKEAKRVATFESNSRIPAGSVVTGKRGSKRTQEIGHDSSQDEGAPTTIVRGRGGRDSAPTVMLSDGADTTTSETSMVSRSRAPRAMEGFELPPLSLLSKSAPIAQSTTRAQEGELRLMADTIVDALQTFDIPARVVDWIVGPTVTLYKVEIAKGVRLNRITALVDDLALAMAATTLRILAPIPGESLVGIEMPNDHRSAVTLGDVLPPAGDGAPLKIAIGKDVSGESVIADLTEMPHLLIGGSTGSGKSVAINTMLMSMLMRATPSEVRLILIDPKRVEMSYYADIPHLYVPVVTEAKDAAAALAWAVTEMDRRLRVMQKAKVKDIGLYNALLQSPKRPDWAEEMPYIVIVIDELADLMMVAAREVEDSIVRLSQLARAAGIHLIVATQRPEANVVTGIIKANIVNRIAFSVASSIDSRVVLDQPGAEKLTGKGDMLFSTPRTPKPRRIQGCFVSEDEVNRVVEMLKAQCEPDYHKEILTTKVGNGAGRSGGSGDDDPLFWDAAEMIVAAGMGSTSSIQRRFSVGYARAGRIMDMLYDRGIVGPADGSKPREVLVDYAGLEAIRNADMEDEVF